MNLKKLVAEMAIIRYNYQFQKYFLAEKFKVKAIASKDYDYGFVLTSEDYDVEPLFVELKVGERNLLSSYALDPVTKRLVAAGSVSVSGDISDMREIFNESSLDKSAAVLKDLTLGAGNKLYYMNQELAMGLGLTNVDVLRKLSMAADGGLLFDGKPLASSSSGSSGSDTGGSGGSNGSGGDTPQVPVTPKATRFMLASHTVAPNNSISTEDTATVPKQTYSVADITVERAPWAANRMIWCWQNAYTNKTGSTPAELDAPTEITIRAAIYCGGRIVKALTFDGASEKTIAAGGKLWCDPVLMSDLPATGQLSIRTYSKLPSGGKRVGRRQRTSLDTRTNIFATATEQEALDMLNDVTKTFVNNSSYPSNIAFGPVLQAADNWDQRPVALIVGDSIAAGNDNAEARSWLSDALYSTVGTRYGYANFAIHGTRASNQTGDNQYGRKAELIDSLIAINGGELPMTFIISEMGVNDAGTLDSEALRVKVKAFLDYIKAKWSSVKLYQTTYTPRVTPDPATVQTDTAAMLTKTASPEAADRWGVAEWIKTKPAPITDFIDVREAWTGSPTGTVWFVPPWDAKLTAAAAVGATEIQVDVAPPAEIVPVIGVNTANVETTLIPITDITGTGPYVVKLGKALTKAHAVGDVVKATPAADGLHPEEGYMSKRAQAVVEAAKVAGKFAI